MFSIRTYMTMLKHVQVLIPCNLGRTHWVLARVNLMEGRIYLLDPYRQRVQWEHRLYIDDYVLRTHETTIRLLKSRCNDFSDYDCASLSVTTVNLLQGTSVFIDKTSDLKVSTFFSPHRS